MGWHARSMLALIRTLDKEIEKAENACEELRKASQVQTKKFQYSKEMLEYWIEARERIAGPRPAKLI
jgi:hypothetical protein